MTSTVQNPATATIPSSQELIERAIDLVPLLRENAAKADRDRRIPEENIRALDDSGLLRATRPPQHGGYEIDPITKNVVMGTLARGCGSTAWVATLLADGNFLAAKFPDEVQDEVFADPDAKVSATLIAAGRAERDGAGFRVSGKWPFNTGCLHAQWVAQPAVVELEAGRPEVCFFLMPYTELTIVDDWDVSGLRGTGSNTVTGQNVYVPQERMVRLAEAKSGKCFGELNKDKPLYRIPPVPYIITSGGAAFPGLAQAAYDLFMEKLPNRGPIAYTGYTQRNEAAITHHQVAEVALKMECANDLLTSATATVWRKALDNEPYTGADMPRIWGQVSYATRLFGEVIEVLRVASGAHAIYNDQPMSLIARDAAALSTHAAMMPTTGVEHYGRSLSGQEPNTPWL